jgi:hypothetical protein
MGDRTSILLSAPITCRRFRIPLSRQHAWPVSDVTKVSTLIADTGKVFQTEISNREQHKVLLFKILIQRVLCTTAQELPEAF